MKKRSILVIEDDHAIRRGVVDALKYDGYHVFEESTGQGGLESALKVDCDLILLDLVLPGRDGLDILAELRKSRARVPVIILTARGTEEDRVRGLKLGADDYVVKPFSAKELLARVEAVLRRSAERPSDIDKLAIPGGVVDFLRREVRFDSGGAEVLTEREEDVLRHLAQNAGRAVGREELLSHVWRINPRGIVETRTVDMTIARLREKLREDPAEPKVLITVRGKGYMIANGDGSE